MKFKIPFLSKNQLKKDELLTNFNRDLQAQLKHLNGNTSSEPINYPLARELTAVPTVDKTASGITTQLNANEAQAFGDVVRINSSGKAQIAKADVIANATALAMCVSESVAADGVGNYLLIGFVRNNAWTLTAGSEVYLSLTGTTGNTITQTSPFEASPIVEDTVVQLLGVANTDKTFYFNPQLVQVELKP